MALTPDTLVRLVKVPLQLNNKNQLTFSNLESQFNYFNNCIFIEETNFTYQRKDNMLRFPAHIDSILEFNYVMYQNRNYGNKWFYCFVTGMNYKNDNCTEIYIETDVFQTWQFDLTYKESFIEREIVPKNLDVPGNFLQPENLETGEMVAFENIGVDNLDACYVIAFLGDQFGQEEVGQDGYRYNGIDQSVTFIVTLSVKFALTVINASNQSNQILSAFAIPKIAVASILGDLQEQLYKILDFDFFQEPIDIEINKPVKNGNYTPRNKKLLTYPYNYLAFNPLAGTKQIYRYENFEQQIIFKFCSELNINPTVLVIPLNYQNIDGLSLQFAGTVTGYPQISTRTDYFNTWLAQNSQTIRLNANQENFNYRLGLLKKGVDLVGDLGGLAVGKVSKLADLTNTGFDMLGADVNYYYYIQNQMAQIEKQKLIPDTANLSDSNSTALGYSLVDNNIFTNYCLKLPFAEKIDKFFDMFGYQICAVKIPSLNSRTNWNYVKTTGLIVEANIPQLDLQKIINIFDNGVTLWHNPNTFLDYSQSNN